MTAKPTVAPAGAVKRASMTEADTTARPWVASIRAALADSKEKQAEKAASSPTASIATPHGSDTEPKSAGKQEGGQTAPQFDTAKHFAGISKLRCQERAHRNAIEAEARARAAANARGELGGIGGCDLGSISKGLAIGSDD